MTELSIDRFVDLYANRTSGMSASEVRALFAVAAVVGLVLLRDAPVGVTRPGEPVPVEESPTSVG